MDVPYKVDDQRAVEFLGTLHKSPLEALSSIIDNAILGIRDLQKAAPNSAINPKIEIQLDKDNAQVIVRDSGIGISQEELCKLPQKIAHDYSIRVIDEKKPSEAHGFRIGILAYRLFGEELWIISRTVDGEIAKLKLTIDKAIAPDKENPLFLDNEIEFYFPKSKWSSGTAVVISGIMPEIFRISLSTKRLRDHLTRTFFTSRVQFGIEMVLRTENRRIVLGRPEFQGDEITISPTFFEDGEGRLIPVEFRLFFPPEGEPNLGVAGIDKDGTSRIDIRSLPGCDSKILQQLHGTISVAGIPQGSTRTTLAVASEEFLSWREKVAERMRHEAAPQIKEIETRRVKERTPTEEIEQAKKIAAQALKEAGIKVPPITKEKEEEKTPPRIKPKKKTETKEKAAEKLEGGKRKRKPKPTTQQLLGRIRPIIWQELTNWPHQPERRFNYLRISTTLQVNRSHPDYQKAKKKGKNSLARYRAVIIIAAIMADYPPEGTTRQAQTDMLSAAILRIKGGG